MEAFYLEIQDSPDLGPNSRIVVICKDEMGKKSAPHLTPSLPSFQSLPALLPPCSVVRSHHSFSLFFVVTLLIPRLLKINICISAVGPPLLQTETGEAAGWLMNSEKEEKGGTERKTGNNAD